MPARRRHAFTLMEVLLVLAILVILGSLVAMSFTGVLGQSDKDAAKAQIGLFKTPLETFFLHVKQYPSTQSGLNALIQPPGDLPMPDKWHGPYMDTIPVDPWGQPYNYSFPGSRNPSKYDVWSSGPDRASGTEDDIGNW